MPQTEASLPPNGKTPKELNCSVSFKTKTLLKESSIENCVFVFLIHI